MTDEIFEELVPMMIDRMNEVYGKSRDYKLAISKESEMYESLKEELNKTQQEKLEKYFICSRETTAICEKLAYKQGMEDLTAILGIDDKRC